MLKSLIVFISLLCLFSCAEKVISNGQKTTDLSNSDFEKYLTDASGIYLKSSDLQTIKFEKQQSVYFEKIISRLVSSNESILQGEKKIALYVVKENYPFVFSMPDCSIFYSSSMFEKYLKSEELFVATLAAEYIKCSKMIYEKKYLYPLGFITTDKMLYLSKIENNQKIRLNEVTYMVLKRAGYDASAYLNWIQVQNRNSLDFSIYLGDKNQISKEEQSLKYFMSKQGINSIEKRGNEFNSSKEFYELIKIIKKGLK